MRSSTAGCAKWTACSTNSQAIMAHGATPYYGFLPCAMIKILYHELPLRPASTRSTISVDSSFSLAGPCAPCACPACCQQLSASSRTSPVSGLQVQAGNALGSFPQICHATDALAETIDASNNHLWGYHVSLPDSSFQASRQLDRQLKADGPLAFAVIDHPRRFPPTGLLGQAHLPPLCRMDRSYRLHLVLPATILQHPLLPQRGSQYPHRHHDLGRLLPDGDQRIRTLISNALASGLEGLFLDTQESEEALFLLPKEEDF